MKTYGENTIALLMSMKQPHKWTDGEIDILIGIYKTKVKEAHE